MENQIIKLSTVDSTNNYTAKLITQTKIPFGTVIMADFQSKGKGQRNQPWVSEKSKNLLVSIFVNSSFLNTKSIFYLSKITALALREFIYDTLQMETLIKWPNDIIIGDKKIAGILIENQWKNSYIKSSIIGLGININQVVFPKKLNATSFKKISGKNYDLTLLLNLLNSKFNSWFSILKNQELAVIDKKYHDNLLNYGNWSIYRTKEIQFKAKLCNVNQLGLLTLKLEDGNEQQFSIKEVSQVI